MIPSFFGDRLGAKLRVWPRGNLYHNTHGTRILVEIFSSWLYSGENILYLTQHRLTWIMTCLTLDRGKGPLPVKDRLTSGLDLPYPVQQGWLGLSLEWWHLIDPACSVNEWPSNTRKRSQKDRNRYTRLILSARVKVLHLSHSCTLNHDIQT